MSSNRRPSRRDRRQVADEDLEEFPLKRQTAEIVDDFDDRDEDDDAGDGDSGGGSSSSSQTKSTSSKVKHGFSGKTHRKALKWALFINWTVFLGFLATTTAIGQYHGNKNEFFVNYFIEGDNSVNGDVYRSASLAFIGAIVGNVIGGLSCILLTYRYCTREKNHTGFYKTAHHFNAWTYVPVAIMEAFWFLICAQSAGRSHLWFLIYGALGGAVADMLMGMTRLTTAASTRYQATNRGKPYKLSGSSLFTFVSILLGKLVPAIIVAVTIGARGPGVYPLTVFIVYFIIMGGRVCFTAWCNIYTILWFTFKGGKDNKDVRGKFRWIHLRYDPPKVREGKTATEYRMYNLGTGAYEDVIETHMWIWSTIMFIITILLLVETNVGFGSSDRGGKQIYERITDQITGNQGDQIFPQFDRTWPMGRVFLPIITGLPSIMMVVLAVSRCSRGVSDDNALLTLWVAARDPWNGFAFGVGRGLLCWIFLSVVGTTEFCELFLGMLMSLISSMIWAETTRNHSLPYGLLAMSLGSLPYIHGTINYYREANQSNVELAAVIVMFVVFGCSQLLNLYFLCTPVTKDMESKDMHNDKGTGMVDLGVYSEQDVANGITDEYRAWHPDTVVIGQLWCNALSVIAGIAVLYWNGGMHWGQDISNPL